MKVAARLSVASSPGEGPRTPGRRPRTARRRYLRGRWRARDAADGLLGSLGSEEPAGGGRGVGFFHSRSEGRASLLLCSTPPSGRVRSVALASRSGAGGVSVVYDCVWGNPLAGSPATAATARARVVFSLEAPLRTCSIHPRPRSRVKAQNPSRRWGAAAPCAPLSSWRRRLGLSGSSGEW